MRIAIINMVHHGSTGKIMLQTAEVARKSGFDVKTYSSIPFSVRGKMDVPQIENHYVWGSFFENGVHYALGSTLGRNGCYSKRGTRKLIRNLQAFKPDLIHLHNLHVFCINLPMLFRYIKKHNIPVIWTLHDCWAFTGHCPHFTMAKCDKWKTGCHHCPQHRDYPKSYVDNSNFMYRHKQKWFTGVQDLTIVTPSNWLAELVGESFLKDYPVKVIHNGIDLTVFKPTESDFRKKHGCEGKFILLGVAFGWGVRKGLDVFVELASRLDDRFQIVLVGTDDAVDRNLPEGIISIHRTQNQAELAEIYTAADLFVNPTREDTYPTVNMESLACGTPVVTFRTGGSPEMVDPTCGSVVPCDDINALEQEILRIAATRPYSTDACLNKAKEFDMNQRFEEYVKLYTEVQK